MSPPFSRYRVAKSRGANVLKQWDATLDGRTRPSHARIDGEIRESDLNAALQNGYSVGYILCHDGKIFEYTQPERPIRSTAYDLIIADFKEKGYHEYDAQIETLRALSAEYGFDFKEVK